MSIKEHELWKLLQQKIKEEDDSIASDYERSVWNVCEYGIELSKTIRDTFQTYTMHDEVHICNVMTKMIELLGEFKSNLTRDECALLVMSACCHDIGMSVPAEEKKYLLGCPDCMKTYLDQYPKDYIVAYKDGEHDKANITDEILQHYIRTNHHKRIRELLQGFEWPEVLGRFISINEFINVCQSHGEDAEDISRLNNFAPNVDLQLCAVLIRLGDILDFDATRAPDSIYQYINLAHLEGMEIEKSRLEWQKHKASRGFTIVSGEHPSLLHRAECTSIQIEQAIISYLNWVDDELSACGKLIGHMGSRWRNIILPSKVNRQITSNGYVSGEYKITLDQERVLDLLVGRELYSDPAVFVRELIQNSIDAVRTRKEMDKNLPKYWKPQINIYTWVDDEGYYWFCIEDNGIGMTEESIQSYFLKVGHSYYNSEKFEADKIHYGVNTEYKPISRFGIGILSCFMGDSKNNRVEVTTKHFKENSERYPAYRLSIQGINGYYYLANDNDHRRTAPKMPDYLKRGQAFITEPGTIVAVRTNLYQSGGARSFKDIIDKYVIYPEIPIHYEGIEGTCDYKTEQEFMDAIHELTPRPCDDVYRPIERIPISEDDFQKLQNKFPEVKWEEKPSIGIYCLPFDYFTSNPMLKGATVIAKGEGKGVWQTNSLDQRYVPKVRIETYWISMYKSICMVVSFYLPGNVKKELDEFVLPIAQSQLQELNIEIDMDKDSYEKYATISLLPLHNLNDIDAEKFRAYQASMSSYICENSKMRIEEFSWYQCWFNHQIDTNYRYDVHISSNIHNGIYADDSQILPFELFFVSNSLLMLRDGYCPRLNISRNRIEDLPLEAFCNFDVLTNQIQKSLGLFKDEEEFGYYSYGRIHGQNGNTPVRDYWKVLEHNPYLSDDLYFTTDKGKITLSSIMKILQIQDKVEFKVGEKARLFQLAVLMKYFDLRIDFPNNKKYAIYIIKRTEPSFMDKVFAFPVALFLPPVRNEVIALSAIGEDKESSPFYNANHPFAKWLIRNQIALQDTVPGIYSNIIRLLRYGVDSINSINLVLSRLRLIPHLGIEIPPDLTLDDFVVLDKAD